VSRVIDELVEGALRELADEDAQAALWSASEGPEVSSLAEAKSRLWDDSGLGDAMERDIVFTEGIDAQLRRLREFLHRVDENAPVETLLASPQVAIVRTLARELLVALRNFGYERAGP
jgi:hypothetical protein